MIDKTPVNLSGEEAAWLKIYLLREALKIGYEWIAFLDADCEIRSHTPDFRDIHEQIDTESSTFMAEGFSGRINSGVIFMRNSLEAKNYLNQVIDHRYKPVPEEDKAPFENGHMIKFGKNNPSVRIIDNILWNNNKNYDPKSYIQHYSGGKLRPLYLNKHPVSKFIYKLKKKWSAHQAILNSNTKADVKIHIEWFKKRYL